MAPEQKTVGEVASARPQKLFTIGTQPGLWVALELEIHWMFTAQKDGWRRKTLYKGTLEALVPADVKNATGTGFPIWERSLAYQDGYSDGLAWDLSNYASKAAVRADTKGWDDVTIAQMGAAACRRAWGLKSDGDESAWARACSDYCAGAYAGACADQAERTGAAPGPSSNPITDLQRAVEIVNNGTGRRETGQVPVVVIDDENLKDDAIPCGGSGNSVDTDEDDFAECTDCDAEWRVTGFRRAQLPKHLPLLSK